MSGHSKWAQIRHKKGASDQKRSQLFAKFSKNITLAAKKGLDPRSNLSLANAIDQARSMNMPNDSIERAIKKVSEKGAAQLEEILVEAIGPGGIALQIKGVTDNKNRTIAEIKTILNNHHSKMVPPGSIAWMFGNPATLTSADQTLLEQLLEDLDNNDDVDDVLTNLTEQ